MDTNFNTHFKNCVIQKSLNFGCNFYIRKTIFQILTIYGAVGAKNKNVKDLTK